MDHVAIMKKSWGLTPKILSGKKTIESRWYKNKAIPWDRIKAGDIMYFKNSGEQVTLKANVRKVLQFENLRPSRVRGILNEYGQEDGINHKDTSKFYQLFKGKRYCILMFLENAQSVEPFNINKSGFGAMSAWITVDDIKSIKKG